MEGIADDQASCKRKGYIKQEGLVKKANTFKNLLGLMLPASDGLSMSLRGGNYLPLYHVHDSRQ